MTNPNDSIHGDTSVIDRDGNRCGRIPSVGGLTKREHFAGLAMPSIIAAGDNYGCGLKEAARRLGITEAEYNGDVHFPIIAAMDAVIAADALIAELNKATT